MATQARKGWTESRLQAGSPSTAGHRIGVPEEDNSPGQATFGASSRVWYLLPPQGSHGPLVARFPYVARENSDRRRRHTEHGAALDWVCTVKDPGEKSGRATHPDR